MQWIEWGSEGCVSHFALDPYQMCIGLSIKIYMRGTVYFLQCGRSAAQLSSGTHKQLNFSVQ